MHHAATMHEGLGENDLLSPRTGGRSQSHRRQHSLGSANNSPRLLLVSNKVKNSLTLQTAVLPNVTYIQYRYDSENLEHLLSSVVQQVGRRTESIALIFHGTTNYSNVTGSDDMILSVEDLKKRSPVCEFFIQLVAKCIDRGALYPRLDLLACSVAQNADLSAQIAEELSNLLQIPVGISKDIMGHDIILPSNALITDGQRNISVGELYFQSDRIAKWGQQTMAEFEKIRTVGKGAYGTAVLYRKKDDDSFVILKEINMHDLQVNERQMTLNEVKVLAMLQHPNIISYYDSFEEDGIVMIEMEYADGGTLSQYLARLEQPMKEVDIVRMFSQIVSAIKYIHERKILHRDLKTDNIFLMKDGMVKIGDFGISKLLSTASPGANTVLGTPYYISPEMCEGNAYNEKSDIWAMGCIAYEMACLQRTFESSNLPALVNKIMKGQFAPIKGDYSEEMKMLIKDMLQREPEYRPSASELARRMAELQSSYADTGTTDYDDDPSNKEAQNRKRTRSVLYYFDMAQVALTPTELPSRNRIRHVAVGSEHTIVVTMERLVYSWGTGAKGQLGHGDLEPRDKPTIIEALKGKSVVSACCGAGFSMFGCDNGIVLTCGDGTSGCLGHGDWCSTSKPRLIEALLSVDIKAIACGPHHAVAVGLSSEESGEFSEIFTWGRGADGRLGSGNEEDSCLPRTVPLPEKMIIVDCWCGHDGTMLYSETASLLACGSNEHNKLGLNQRQGFLNVMKSRAGKTEVACEKVFTVSRQLSHHRVIDICMGQHHTALLVEPGQVIMVGRNSEAQLGTGNTKPQNAVVTVKTFEQLNAYRVQCGQYFTVASTVNNELLMWGAKYRGLPKVSDVVDPPPVLNAAASNDPANIVRQPSSTADLNKVPDNGSSEVMPNGNAQLSVAGGETRVTSASKAGAAARQPALGKRVTSAGGDRVVDPGPDRDTVDIIMQPTPVLRMDSAGQMSGHGDTVALENIYVHGHNLYILVETTAPLPKRKVRKKPATRKRSLGGEEKLFVNIQSSFKHEGDTSTSEFDTRSTIPTWLHLELQENPASASDAGNEADDTSDHSDGGNQESSDAQLRRPTSESPRKAVTDEELLKMKPAAARKHERSRQTTTASQHDVLSSSGSSDVLSMSSKRPVQPAATSPKAFTRPRVNMMKAPRKAFAETSSVANGAASTVDAKQAVDTLQLQDLDTPRNDKVMMDEHRRLQAELDTARQEREAALKSEVELLRYELQQQRIKMQENTEIIVSLQRELQKMHQVQQQQQQQQEPQVKVKVRPLTATSAVSASSATPSTPRIQRENSRICSMQ